MKELVIGVVGGMGTYATIDFFKRIADAFPAEKEWERPRIIIDNYCTMPSRVRAILYNEKKEELIDDLCSSVKYLTMAGANKIVFACNTSHVFLKDVCERIPEAESCLLNIIEVCGEDICNDKVKQVKLIATEGTIETGIYNEVMKNYNVDVILPSEEDFTLLRDFIEAIKQNKISDCIMQKFENYIENFEEEAVILGCTEFPPLYSECMKHGYKFTKKIYDPLQSVINRLKTIYYDECK